MTDDPRTSTGTTTYPRDPLGSLPTGAEFPEADPSTGAVAKDEASDLAQNAAGAGKHVTGVASDQAGNVAAEATAQAKDLLAQARTELQEQAAVQQQRIAAGIRSLSDELSDLLAGSSGSGTASELVRRASDWTAEVSSWLDQRDPGSLVDEATRFARRRPGVFLAIAAGAGLLAGRLTRGAIAGEPEPDPSVPRQATTGSPAATSAPGFTTEATGDGFPHARIDDGLTPATDAWPAPTATEPLVPAEVSRSWEGQARP